jgi:hypothetical protein
MPDQTWTLTVTFTVHETSDDFIQSAQAIQEEFESWLEGLGATVRTVTIRPADELNGGGE